jgi:hypothetical protein
MQHPELVERQQQANLVRLAERWQEITGWELSTLSRRAHSDPRFFEALFERYKSGTQRTGIVRDSGSFTVRIYDKLLVWFYDPANYPNGEVPPLNFVYISHKPRRKQNGTHPRRKEQAQKPIDIEKASPRLASDLLAKLRGG